MKLLQTFKSRNENQRKSINSDLSGRPATQVEAKTTLQSKSSKVLPNVFSSWKYGDNTEKRLPLLVLRISYVSLGGLGRFKAIPSTLNFTVFISILLK